ncbi:MAG: hypothetical protein HY043_17610 [Verrucomicrobia bacterium]|nr:hypothetical protein [Verrucomicrobiota bacterium]
MPEDFDKLVVLLRMKRHEQPPPGYFAGFSRRVIAQLEAQQPARSLSWWRKFLADFDAKPILVGAYSVAVCGSLLYGITLLNGTRDDFQNLPLGQSTWSDSLSASAGVGSGMSLPPFSHATAAFPLTEGSVVLGEMPNANALFDGSLLKVQRAKAGNTLLNW